MIFEGYSKVVTFQKKHSTRESFVDHGEHIIRYIQPGIAQLDSSENMLN